ncbi:hypothetical protein, partial [Streptococcus pneumoniae]|uniref:hypothetical protein n=1 Tax=Streptococcus pneumoniae TaxID=1313 RepID=UPI001E5BDFF4
FVRHPIRPFRKDAIKLREVVRFHVVSVSNDSRTTKANVSKFISTQACEQYIPGVQSCRNIRTRHGCREAR